jgi:hypothetical protein
MMCMRKTLIVVLLVAFQRDQRLQGMVGMLLIFIACMLQMRAPFTMTPMNTLEFCSLGTSAATFFLGQLTLDPGTLGQEYQLFASQLALVINIIFMMVAATSAWHIFQSDVKFYRRMTRRVCSVVCCCCVKSNENSADLEFEDEQVTIKEDGIELQPMSDIQYI